MAQKFTLKDGTEIKVRSTQVYDSVSKTTVPGFAVSAGSFGQGPTRRAAFHQWRQAREEDAQRRAQWAAQNADPESQAQLEALDRAERETARIIREAYQREVREAAQARQAFESQKTALEAQGFKVVGEGALPKLGCRRVLDWEDVDSGERWYKWIDCDGQTVQPMDGWKMYIVKK